MKELLISFFLFLSGISVVFPQTHTVIPNGSGDYLTIQEAVDVAVIGDTILVWPGEYLENIIIEDKSIVLGSLYLTTGINSYVDSTKINGNKTGGCIAVLDCSDTVKIYGFSITNGSGYEKYPDLFYGGGIFVNNSAISIYNCNIYNNEASEATGGIYASFSFVNIIDSKIKNNFSPSGPGGICIVFESLLHISNTTVAYNHSYYSGGGIAIVGNSHVVFDSVNRCNIYLNFAGGPNDIYINSDSIIRLYADTLTVLNPGNHFISSTDDFGNPQDEIELYSQNCKITQYNGNLYVNPITGNDMNSGTHPNSALKTIAFAYAKIKIDSLANNTIYLADGVYSDSTNNEKFPINLKSFITLKGKGMEKTILDGRYKSFLIKGLPFDTDYCVSNLTIQKGTRMDYYDVFNNTDLFGTLYYYNNNVIFDSIRFRYGIGQPGRSALGITRSNNVRVSNCIFEDIKGIDVLDIGSQPDDTCYVYNCIFRNIKPDYNHPNKKYGKALRVSGSLSGGPGTTVVQNNLFLNIDQASISSSFNNTWIINNTFVNSSLEVPETANVVISGSKGYAYNNISYNNGQYPFWINKIEGVPSSLSVYNSCTEGGEDSFTLYDASLYYDESNIDDDPMFYGGEEYPYNLHEDSPCINTGSLDVIPDWIEIPEFDLAGNPRVTGDEIDMGAYEWNPSVDIEEVNIKEEGSLVIYPVPTKSNVTIELTGEYNEVEVYIYNTDGRFVSSPVLLSKTNFNRVFQWAGTNYSGHICLPGMYFVIAKQNNKIIASGKVLKN